MISVEKIVVPRCVVKFDEINALELHGFGDASEKGFGCAIYIRVIYGNENYYVNLLCAKSRVASLKKQTIPRLELCAALLLSQLMFKVIEAMEIKFNNIFYWSDSEIILLRIKSNPSNFCTFLGNRISQTQ